MLIEYEFITTKEAPAFMEQAAAYLTSLGFAPLSIAPEASRFKRGRKKCKKYARLEDLPQQLEISFDRGRVSCAVSVLHFGRYWDPLHAEMLKAVVLDLAALFGTGPAVAPNLLRYPAVKEKLNRQALKVGRSKRRLRVAAAILGGLFVCSLGLGAVFKPGWFGLATLSALAALIVWALSNR